jgi:hypothetical protein
MEASPGTMAQSLYSLVEIAQDISDQTRLMQISKGRAGADAEIMAEDQTVINGDCGGQIVLSMVQDEGGSISGGIAANDYCASLDEETQIQIDGEATLSGSIQELSNGGQKISLQLDTTAPITIQLGADAFSISITDAALSMTQTNDAAALTLTLQEAVFTDGSDRYTLGDVSISISMTQGDAEDQIVIDVDSFQLDEDTSEGSVTHQLSGVSITVTSGATGSTMAVSGTYINSEEGAVTLSTPELITVSSEGEIASGNVIVSGAQGTQISVEAYGGNLFLIEADTNGDGVYDYQPGTMDCSAFDAGSLF